MKKLTGVTMATLIAAWFFAPWAANAAPQNTDILDVYHRGDAVSSGAVVDGDIEIEVSSSAALGLDWLRIEARLDGESAWTCLRQWSGGGATNMVRDYRWKTTAWPQASATGCPGSLGGDGSRTLNGVYELRAKARESTTGAQQPSNNDTVHFKVKVNNPASTPSWTQVSAFKLGDRPKVELKWNTVPDPDVLEYHFIRQGPDGRKEFAVSAKAPGGQGCNGPKAPNQGMITCIDDAFSTSGYGGTYRYSLVAYRATPLSGPSCSPITSQPCTGGPQSAQQSAEITEPSPSPSPSTPGSSSPTTSPRSSPSRSPSSSSSPSSSPSASGSPSQVQGSRTDNSEFYTGSYDEQLPYDDQPGFSRLPGSFEGDSSGSDDGIEGDGQTLASSGPGFGEEPLQRRLYTSLAAGLLMMLVALHIVRLLYDS